MSENSQIGIEQAPFGSRQIAAEHLPQRFDFLPHLSEATLEQAYFSFGILIFPARHRLETDIRGRDHHRTQCDSRHSGHSVEHRAFSDPATSIDRSYHLGMGDRRRQLRRQGHQKRLFVGTEAATFVMLRDQHADHSTPMDDRHADKGVHWFFIQARHGEKIGVLPGLLQIQQQAAVRHQPDQTLTSFHPDRLAVAK